MNKNERSNQNYTIPKTPNQIRSIRFPEQLTTYRKCIKQKHFRAWWLYISTSRRGIDQILKMNTTAETIQNRDKATKRPKREMTFPFFFFWLAPSITPFSTFDMLL